MTVRDSGNQGTHSPHGHGLGVARHAARRAAVHLPHCKSMVTVTISEHRRPPFCHVLLACM